MEAVAVDVSVASFDGILYNKNKYAHMHEGRYQNHV